MPSALLSVPHYEQSRDGACLPACGRMVLVFWNDHRSELEVGKILGARSYGTPFSREERLRRLGYQVDFGLLIAKKLQGYLIAGRPIIARVWTAMVDYWQGEITSHVVVVVRFTHTHIYLNDPALRSGAQTISWDSFLAAWTEFDETVGVIYPSRKFSP